MPIHGLLKHERYYWRRLHAHKNSLWRFWNKNLEEYLDLYIQSDALLLADVFENVWNTCVEIYECNPARFSTAPGLAWQAALRVYKSKIRSFD